MKAIVRILPIAFVIMLITFAGCEPVPPAPTNGNSPKLHSAYSPYTPQEIDVIPLTQFVRTDGQQEIAKIRVFVSLLDAFGSQMKSPAVFRFELYQYLQRSADPKGKRLVHWKPDTDLTDAAENNKYWRDFLRAYEFSLDFWPAGNKDYVLQATCLCPNGRRLSADFLLKATD